MSSLLDIKLYIVYNKSNDSNSLSRTINGKKGKWELDSYLH